MRECVEMKSRSSAKLRIAIVDTTFSTVDMGKIAVDELTRQYPSIRFIRRTVPGFKDLAVECQQLFTCDGCDNRFEAEARQPIFH